MFTSQLRFSFQFVDSEHTTSFKHFSFKHSLFKHSSFKHSSSEVSSHLTFVLIIVNEKLITDSITHNNNLIMLKIMYTSTQHQQNVTLIHLTLEQSQEKRLKLKYITSMMTLYVEKMMFTLLNHMFLKM